MSGLHFEPIGSGYTNTSQVPKDNDLLYRCTLCGATIRSVPRETGGCKCGNIFIDKECWRLIVEDFKHLRWCELSSRHKPGATLWSDGTAGAKVCRRRGRHAGITMPDPPLTACQIHRPGARRPGDFSGLSRPDFVRPWHQAKPITRRL